MVRKKALVKFALGGMIPGALLGAGGALLAVYANQKQSEMALFLGIGAAIGVVGGALIGALIADHRYPP